MRVRSNRVSFARSWLACMFFFSASVWSATGWVWLDESGRRVFSDVPPPSSIPDQRIIQRPGPPKPVTNPPVSPPISDQEPKEATPAKPAISEERIKAENEAIEKENAKIMAENCRKAREALATLEKPGRLATLNDKGQRVLMNDASRKAEIARMQDVIRDNCR